MDVSSVHWPGSSLNGPPSAMPTIGLNEPGGLNSKHRTDRVSYRKSQHTTAESIDSIY
jgi:hypothetical protein